MKIAAMDESVLDSFASKVLKERGIIPGSLNEDEHILNNMQYSNVSFCLLPINIEYLHNKGQAKIIINILKKCRTRISDNQNQKINQRTNELLEHYGEREDCCRLLAEAEECGVNFLLTRNGNFISELGRKAKNVKIIRPIDFAN
jgi:hypothetical protein